MTPQNQQLFERCVCVSDWLLFTVEPLLFGLLESSSLRALAIAAWCSSCESKIKAHGRTMSFLYQSIQIKAQDRWVQVLGSMIPGTNRFRVKGVTPTLFREGRTHWFVRLSRVNFVLVRRNHADQHAATMQVEKRRKLILNTNFLNLKVQKNHCGCTCHFSPRNVADDHPPTYLLMGCI